MKRSGKRLHEDCLGRSSRRGACRHPCRKWPRKFRIAVFASGSGSNFQAIVDTVQRGELHADIELLVCDKPKAHVVERAQQRCARCLLSGRRIMRSREAYEAEIVRAAAARYEIDLIVLAGYMRLITHVLIEPYDGRIDQYSSVVAARFSRA